MTRGSWIKTDPLSGNSLSSDCRSFFLLFSLIVRLHHTTGCHALTIIFRCVVRGRLWAARLRRVRLDRKVETIEYLNLLLVPSEVRDAGNLKHAGVDLLSLKGVVSIKDLSGSLVERNASVDEGFLSGLQDPLKDVVEELSQVYVVVR